MESPATPNAASDLDSFALAQTHARWTSLRAEIERAATAPDEDAIHDVRVAIRRLSTALALFGFAFADKGRRRVRRELRDLRRLAGEARDRDIASRLAKAEGFRKSHPIAKRWRKERERAAKTLIAALRKVQSDSAADRWRKQLARTGPAAEAGDWAPELSACENGALMLPMLARDLFQFGRDAVSTDCEPAVLHELRLKAKGLRYALELFRPVYGYAMERRIRVLRELQDHLGEFNDAVVAAERVRTTVKRGAQGRKKLLRAFERLAAQRSVAAIEHWQGVFDADGQERWWVGYLQRPRKKLAVKPIRRAASQEPVAVPAAAAAEG